MRSNVDVWRKIMFHFMITNIPTNVYLWTRIVLTVKRKGWDFETALYWTVLLGQLVTLALVLAPLAKYTAAIHAIQKRLVGVQYSMGGGRMFKVQT